MFCSEGNGCAAANALKVMAAAANARMTEERVSGFAAANSVGEELKVMAAAANARMTEERAAKADFARLKKARLERAAKSAAFFRGDKKSAATQLQSLNICIPPGSLGVGINNINGYCTVISKTNQHSPLEVLDIITSLNGINLVECESGVTAWVTLFGACEEFGRTSICE